MTHEVAHSLHVSPNTWIAVIILLTVILYVPLIEKHYEQTLTVHTVIGLGWSLWFFSFIFRAKLGHVMYMLTPSHPLLDGPPMSFDNEAPTASKHERLFWRGRAGPGHLLFLLRLQMLSTAIALAVLYTWLTSNPQDTNMPLRGFLP